jgi:signal transduction histidine kinase
MFGVGAHSVLTTGALIKAVHPDDRRVAIASIRAATFGNLTDGVSEFRVVGAKGEIRWLQARGQTSLDASGRPTRISGIFRDISGYKAAQKETELLFRRLMTIQDEERQRIAQELHDSTAQHIAAACLNLIALRGTGDGKPASSRIFQDTEDCLEQASRELRAFTYLLNPPELAKDGFSATLRRYVEGFRRRTGLAVSLRLNGASDHLSAALQQPFLRIIQEALANVHRHAAATCVSIRLSHVAGRVHLVIVDDGRGVMDKESPQRNRSELLPSGVGLAGMTARAQQFGGTLNVRFEIELTAQCGFREVIARLMDGELGAFAELGELSLGVCQQTVGLVARGHRTGQFIAHVVGRPLDLAHGLAHHHFGVGRLQSVDDAVGASRNETLYAKN